MNVYNDIKDLRLLEVSKFIHSDSMQSQSLSPTLNLLALSLSRLPSSRINGNSNGLIDGWTDEAADGAVLTPPTTLTLTSQMETNNNPAIAMPISTSADPPSFGSFAAAV